MPSAWLAWNFLNQSTAIKLIERVLRSLPKFQCTSEIKVLLVPSLKIIAGQKYFYKVFWLKGTFPMMHLKPVFCCFPQFLHIFEVGRGKVGLLVDPILHKRWVFKTYSTVQKSINHKFPKFSPISEMKMVGFDFCQTLCLLIIAGQN